MEINKLASNLIEALEQQEYYFSDELKNQMLTETYDYKTGFGKKMAKFMQGITEGMTKLDINKEEFEQDLRKFNESIDQRMLVTWGYKAANFSIIGIIFADNLSDSELKEAFKKFDEAVVPMRKHAGKNTQGSKLGTYGTFMPVFTDADKAARFNANIKSFYNSRILKGIYTSAMAIDGAKHNVTRGKSGIPGLKWAGPGLDMSLFEGTLFKNL